AALKQPPTGWHPGQFRKRFPNNPLAPALARSALATTVVGIPMDAFDIAALLASELVTNAVKHSTSEWVDVEISLTTNLLRISVSDQNAQTVRPRTPDIEGGWGLTLIGELATRWGVERHSNGKTISVELDLHSPQA
ncbi:MAG: ATP-binding protein, partial [Actinobacteria bacterium]|nr:ATP-binding protein [Actinomycetota bacterium]